MQATIHPTYTPTTFVCSCGHETPTRSTLGGRVSVDVCNNCHPHYTGKGRVMDTAGRIDRFHKRYGKPSADTSAE